MRYLKLICIALAVGLLCSSCQETEVKRRTVGYKGKAKSNSFLAAERFLLNEGVDAAFIHGLGRLGSETSTIFLPPSALNTVGRSDLLLDWVDAGGHLVLMLHGGEMGGNDFTMTSGSPVVEEKLGEGVDYLLGELEVGYEKNEKEGAGGDDSKIEVMDLDDWEALAEKDRVLLGSVKSEIDLGQGALEVYGWMRKNLVYSLEYEGDYVSLDGHASDNSHCFLSLSYGSGRVSLLNDARLIRNRYLGSADHAKFLVHIVDLSRSGKVIFSSGGGDGFFAMLWRHFKLPVIGLIVVVALWLWRHLPRFGPEQDLVGGGSREVGEQVRGIGRFLWHHKRDDALVGGLRSRVNRCLSVHPGVSQEGIFEQLSTKTQIPMESVIEALTREHITEPSVMIRVTQNLQKILKHIH